MRYSRLFPGLPLVLLVGLASSLAVDGKVLAQQGPQMRSVSVPQLPADPDDPAWQLTPLAELPLTPQTAIKPTLASASVSALRVRSVNDGSSIAFLLEWADASRDASASRQDSFRDAAAIQFPTSAGPPSICMGVRGAVVNIWHWKADWQEDIDRGFQDVVDAFPNFYKDTYPGVNILTGQPPFRMPEDFDTPEARQFILGWTAGNPLSAPSRPSPVEDLNAIGFSTLTHKATQNVGGRGVWRDGVWRVIFVRTLQVDDRDAASLTVGKEIPVAFAVWNGSNEEVGARKQISTFLTVTLQDGPGPMAAELPPASIIVPLLAAVVLLGALVALRALYRRRGRVFW